MAQLFAQSSGDEGSTWTPQYPCTTIEDAICLSLPQEEIHRGRVIVELDNDQEIEIFAPLTEGDIEALEGWGFPRS